MNTRNIRIVLHSGLTKTLPYTISGLDWAKAMFADGNLMSWEIVES